MFSFDDVIIECCEPKQGRNIFQCHSLNHQLFIGLQNKFYFEKNTDMEDMEQELRTNTSKFIDTSWYSAGWREKPSKFTKPEI